jgi:hypothetical protein
MRVWVMRSSNALAGEADHSAGRSIGMMIALRLVGRGTLLVLVPRKARRGPHLAVNELFPRLGHSRCISIVLFVGLAVRRVRS